MYSTLVKTRHVIYFEEVKLWAPCKHDSYIKSKTWMNLILSSMCTTMKSQLLHLYIIVEHIVVRATSVQFAKGLTIPKPVLNKTWSILNSPRFATFTGVWKATFSPTSTWRHCSVVFRGCCWSYCFLRTLLCFLTIQNKQACQNKSTLQHLHWLRLWEVTPTYVEQICKRCNHMMLFA